MISQISHMISCNSGSMRRVHGCKEIGEMNQEQLNRALATVIGLSNAMKKNQRPKAAMYQSSSIFKYLQVSSEVSSSD